MKSLLLLVSAIVFVGAYDLKSECIAMQNTVATADAAWECVQQVPISESTKTAVLDTTRKLLKLYSFRDIVAGFAATVPLGGVSVDIDAELDKIVTETNGKVVSAFDFYQMISNRVFVPLADAHTGFTKPDCFNIVWKLPFQLSPVISLEENYTRILISSVEPISNQGMYPLWNLTELNLYRLQEIKKINNVPAYDFLVDWARTHPLISKDPSVNFNYIFVGNSFLSRSAKGIHGNKPEAVSFEIGNSSFSLPWAAEVQGNLSACDVTPAPISVTPPTPGPVTKDAVEVYTDVDNSTLVIRIPSFHTEVNAQLKQKLPEGTHKRLLIDLMNNYGGSVCQVLHLVGFLETPPPAIVYDMIRSPLTDALVAAAEKSSDSEDQYFGPKIWTPLNSSEGWYGPRDITRSGKTSQYTNLFKYTENQCGGSQPEPNPWEGKTRHYDEIVILTNGICGSACAMFAAAMTAETKGVHTVAAGGLKQDMSFATFPGGAVVNDEEILREIKRLNVTGDFVPVQMPVTASITFVLFEVYRTATSLLPEEFMPYVADNRLFLWPVDSAAARREVYQASIPYFGWTKGDLPPTKSDVSSKPAPPTQDNAGVSLDPSFCSCLLSWLFLLIDQ